MTPDQRAHRARALLDAANKVVGFWCQDSGPDDEHPDPRLVGRDSLTPEERVRLMAYLRDPKRVVACCKGVSYCRYRTRGCKPATHMGNCDHSDGTYMWPEGLAHYVEVHETWLPEEFVTHCLRGAF